VNAETTAISMQVEIEIVGASIPGDQARDHTNSNATVRIVQSHIESNMIVIP
jgi:hypothetical protein